MTYEALLNKIQSNSKFTIASQKDLPSGKQIKFNNGAIVNWFNTERITYQGKNLDEVKTYIENDENKKKYRVRQNVILELGMFLAKLGRDKVAILLKSYENFEKPSDIDGLIYIPFTNKVDEVTVNLVKELSKQGYHIDPKLY